jgi:AraC-like DNA-binding protein
MDYNTYSPDPQISAFVKLFWSLDAPGAALPEKQRIVPDGCMEMIFHYGDLFRQYTEDGSSRIQPRSFVFGQITRQLEIAPTGVTGIMAARFTPDGFAPFSTMDVVDMENRAVPLTELFGKLGGHLERDVLATATNEQRKKLIEQFLVRELETPRVVDNISRSSVDLLLELKGQVSVDELADQVGIHRRRLERKFSTVIGLSPKQLSKIIRLQAALKMMEHQPSASLTALAQESGYFDQAHFIKDFKEFTGMSPRQFYAENLRMSALFVGTE